MGLPFVQCFYLIIGALYLFIPIMGRAGAGSHAELLIAIMVSSMFANLFSFVVPLVLLVKGVERIFSLLTGLFLMSLAALILTPMGFPYSGEQGALAPQRFMMAVRKSGYDIFIRCFILVLCLVVNYITDNYSYFVRIFLKLKRSPFYLRR